MYSISLSIDIIYTSLTYDCLPLIFLSFIKIKIKQLTNALFYFKFKPKMQKKVSKIKYHHIYYGIDDKILSLFSYLIYIYTLKKRFFNQLFANHHLKSRIEINGKLVRN